MSLFVNDPAHWRRRANESRMLAATLTDAVARRKMTEVAAAYELMAERAEKYPIKTPPNAERLEGAR